MPLVGQMPGFDGPHARFFVCPPSTKHTPNWYTLRRSAEHVHVVVLLQDFSRNHQLLLCTRFRVKTLSIRELSHFLVNLTHCGHEVFE